MGPPTYPIPKDFYSRLQYSWDMVLCLEDFINCIKLHKADLKSPRNINLMRFMKDFFNDDGFNPGGVLKDYIYLEANSFFECAKMLKNGKGVPMPDLPNYLEELKDFRDIMVAHRDKKWKIQFPDGWIKLQNETQKSIPINKLIKDVDFYFQSLRISPV